MKPNNKIDKLLANIGGEEYEVTPQTPREFFLKEIDERVDADEAAIAAANGRIDGINAVPDYAVSDAGKVLTVTSENVPANLVPEQEITLNTAGAAIANPNTGITLTNGKTVTINGELWGDSKLDTLTDASATVTMEDTTPIIVLTGDTYVYEINCEDWLVTVNNDDTHTTLGDQYSLVKFKIDTTVPAADAEWKDIPAELPAATAADEGHVLTVDSDGDPVWSTPSGGGGVYEVHPVDEEASPWVLNHTYAEIAAAAETSVVVFRTYEGSMLSYLTNMDSAHGSDPYAVAFGNISYMIDSPYYQVQLFRFTSTTEDGPLTITN